MSESDRILVMSGTQLAHGITRGLLARRRPVFVTVPEAERHAVSFAVPCRVGHFDNPADFSDHVTAQGITAVIDASHPFERAASHLAYEACVTLGLPYLRVLRPPWSARGMRWQTVSSVAEAAALVPYLARAFANTGWQSQKDFAGFRGKRLYLRRLAPTEETPPFDFMRYSIGTPPFSVMDEENLFRSLRISHLICRNVGGTASRSKLDAAMNRGMRIIMIERPEQPPGPLVTSVAEALAWEAEL